MAEFKIPTETVTLPSKGLLYPKESPLAKGEIEMKYMTAKEEDILTNANYLKNGTVIDKLLLIDILALEIVANPLIVYGENPIMLLPTVKFEPTKIVDVVWSELIYDKLAGSI